MDQDIQHAAMLLDYVYIQREEYYNLVHEMGHVFGLLHTFANAASSDSTCNECVDYARSTSNILGDRLGDTPPSPKSHDCRQPTGTDCMGTPWGQVLHTNFMSYSDCATTFTPNQRSRMLCYIDAYLYRFFVPRGECVNDTDCNDGDACTHNICRPNGMCTYSVRTCRHRETGNCTRSTCNTDTGLCVDFPRNCRPNDAPIAAEELNTAVAEFGEQTFDFNSGTAGTSQMLCTLVALVLGINFFL